MRLYKGIVERNANYYDYYSAISRLIPEIVLTAFEKIRLMRVLRSSAAPAAKQIKVVLVFSAPVLALFRELGFLFFVVLVVCLLDSSGLPPGPSSIRRSRSRRP